MNCRHCHAEMEWIEGTVRWYSERGLEMSVWLCRRCGLVTTPTPPLSGYMAHISTPDSQDEANRLRSILHNADQNGQWGAFINMSALDHAMSDDEDMTWGDENSAQAE